MNILVPGLLLALVLGLVSLGMVAWVPDRDTMRRLLWLPPTLVLYNLWVVGFLAATYLRGRVTESAPVPGMIPSAQLIAVGLTVLAVAWGCGHLRQICALLDVPVPRRALRAVTATLLVLTLLLAGTWSLFAFTGRATPLQAVTGLARLLAFAAVLGSSVVLRIECRGLKDEVWRRRVGALSSAYIAVFTALIALTFSWRPLSALSSRLPATLDVAVEIAYNLVVVVWLAPLVVWPGAALSAAPSTAIEGHRDVLAREGITKREAEIIDLICRGNTNKEIAEQLFISVATVKDHNYAIFQKLRVRNRTELARLVLRPR